VGTTNEQRPERQCARFFSGRQGVHPITAQPAKGHGLKARPLHDIVGDGVVYFPSATTGEVPLGSR
jgi:hypothetical protein